MLKKIFFTLFFLNFLLFIYFYTPLRQKSVAFFFQDSKKLLTIKEKEINKKRKYLDSLKKLDSDLLLFYKEKKNKESLLKKCKTEIRDVHLISNFNKSIHFNYLDYRSFKYKNIIRCNIYKASDINTLDIKIPYLFLKTSIFKPSMFDEYVEKGYKINWIIIYNKTTPYIYNIFNRIDKEKTNSLYFYFNNDKVKKEKIKIFLKKLFLYYYPKFEGKIITGYPESENKFNKILIKRNISEKELINLVIEELKNKELSYEKILIENSLNEIKKINLFQLEELIKNSRINISIPNNYYFETEEEIKNKIKKELDKIKEKYKNISILDFNFLNQKYKNYFEGK